MTPERRWIHRAIFPDGRIKDSEPHIYAPGQACFARLTQFVLARHFPGVRVIHLVDAGDGEWREKP